LQQKRQALERPTAIAIAETLTLNVWCVGQCFRHHSAGGASRHAGISISDRRAPGGCAPIESVSDRSAKFGAPTLRCRVHEAAQVGWRAPLPAGGASGLVAAVPAPFRAGVLITVCC
jgi:hypothetical protein